MIVRGTMLFAIFASATYLSSVHSSEPVRVRVLRMADETKWLDMYLNPEGNRYYFPPLDSSRLARLERNLGFARAAADEYVCFRR